MLPGIEIKFTDQNTQRLQAIDPISFGSYMAYNFFLN